MPVFDYSPDAELRRLPTLVIVDAAGVETEVPAGKVILAAGANMSLELPEESGQAVLSSLSGGGGEDNYYRRKYEALAATPDAGTVSGGGEDAAHPAWEFSADARWLAGVNDVKAFPADGNFFLSNSVCGCVGAIESASGYPETAAAQLTLLDVCAPAINKLSYARISQYVQRLRLCLDYLLELENNPNPAYIPTAPGGITASPFNGMLQQLTVVRNYWNFLAHRFGVRFNAMSQGQSLVLAHYYRNSGSAAVGDATSGISLSILCSFLRRDSEGVVTPWLGLTGPNILVKQLRRNNADNPPYSMIPATWRYSVDDRSIVISASTEGGASLLLSSGSELVSDFAVMFKSLLLPEDGAEYYMEASAVISPTHMEASVTRQQTVFFTPPIADEEEEETP